MIGTPSTGNAREPAERFLDTSPDCGTHVIQRLASHEVLN